MSNPLYNAAIHLYALAARIASIRSPKIVKMIKGQRETIAKLTALRDNSSGEGPVWIHAASLGEFEQGRPLIERIRALQPNRKIVLSFFSPSGYEVRCNTPLADAVVYLPFDTPRRVNAFLDALNPSMAIFIKYEFWGNYLSELRRRGVPTFLISAIFRPGQIFFRPWGGMFRNMLRCFSGVYVQDSDSERLLREVGLTNVEITGDTRLDRVNEVKNHPPKSPSLARFAPDAAMRLIVGSSWGADEELYIPWLNNHPEVAAIIAPHEFNPQRLERLRESLNGPTLLLSEWNAAMASNPDTPPQVRYIIVDCFGELSSIYRYGHAAYIGGGFGAGIHNINEAAVYGIPVVFGPNHYKFKEASDLLAAGAAMCVTDAQSTAQALSSLLRDRDLRNQAGQAAGAYIRSHLGATDKIYRGIFADIRR